MNSATHLHDALDRTLFGWSTMLGILHAAVLLQAVPFVLRNMGDDNQVQILTVAAACFGVLAILVVAGSVAIQSAADRSRRAIHVLKHEPLTADFARYVESPRQDDIVSSLVNIVLRTVALGWAGFCAVLLVIAVAIGVFAH